MLQRFTHVTSIVLFFLVSCNEKVKESAVPKQQEPIMSDTLATAKEDKETASEEEREKFVLTEENAIDFFFNYADTLSQNKVKLTTSMGSFTIQLFDDVPYHRANFIYLTRKGYFDNTQFHRVVKDFIIQGGNSDDRKTANKRREIGRYLLPPDAKKGYKHHRGVISMPSSERDNPHKLASPYEFFIVVTKPGSYHLDGSYTPFGRVIEGMDVVDAINNVPVGDGDWPLQNVYIEKAEVLD
ncbi:Peptidyl-prolyl cis-trans isomerase [Flagellimonas lutaonensis]|uniref:Peptidyl-prolyl cis-trans isomerase n=2 Tax=Flagellimonas lutaonensis TaxID=516051 RepID=A0A0D5YQC8_9FLAO|nr:peptidylprolyl isomerase [Allomuricauda lutaonensis]AKA34036.1 Peptidyl-prolyl cis-trans isomerase [Allomuricauda lutaonensis]